MGRRGAWAEGAIVLVVGLDLARPQHRGARGLCRPDGGNARTAPARPGAAASGGNAGANIGPPPRGRLRGGRHPPARGGRRLRPCDKLRPAPETAP